MNKPADKSTDKSADKSADNYSKDNNSTGNPEFQPADTQIRLSTGSQKLDKLLGGGIEKGALTEIYGEGGSGKTNFCLVMLKNVALSGKKVAYIDTEGVSLERLKQICGSDFDSVLKNLRLYHVYSMTEQADVVEKCLRLTKTPSSDIGLIVLDSATGLYRLTLGTDEETMSRNSLSCQIINLMTVSRRLEIPTIITSQVYTSLRKETFEPLGGHILSHYAKTIVFFEKLQYGARRATLIKHRAASEGTSVIFYLSASGISDTEPEKPYEILIIRYYLYICSSYCYCHEGSDCSSSCAAVWWGRDCDYQAD
ncbi:MAG: DNA repair and recombination protein RadB [Thermoplasmata archaeon]